MRRSTDLDAEVPAPTPTLAPDPTTIPAPAPPAPDPDRLVWVFGGWSLGRDADVADVTRVLQTASRHGLNGAV